MLEKESERELVLVLGNFFFNVGKGWAMRGVEWLMEEVICI